MLRRGESVNSNADRLCALHQISNTVISGRQLKRMGTGYQPMPGLTYNGPAGV